MAISLVKTTDDFGSIVRPVKVSEHWPIAGVTEQSETTTIQLAGPIVLDVYDALKTLELDTLIETLIDSAIRASEVLNGWNEDQIRELRSAAWRSAHNYVINNVGLVDRSREQEEIFKLLKVKV